MVENGLAYWVCVLTQADWWFGLMILNIIDQDQCTAYVLIHPTENSSTSCE